MPELAWNVRARLRTEFDFIHGHESRNAEPSVRTKLTAEAGTPSPVLDDSANAKDRT
jgi:hypothetical protein